MSHRPDLQHWRAGRAAIMLAACLAMGLLPAIASAEATTRGSLDPTSIRQSRPFRAPVTAPVRQSFDEPDGPYGRGHRGLDYDVHRGDPVHAIGDGTVVYVGTVVGNRFVTVLHAGGLRSTYGYLGSVTVHRGQRVTTGDLLAASSTRLLLTIRSGQRYVDPERLIGTGPGPSRHAHLVRWNLFGWW